MDLSKLKRDIDHIETYDGHRDRELDDLDYRTRAPETKPTPMKETTEAGTHTEPEYSRPWERRVGGALLKRRGQGPR